MLAYFKEWQALMVPGTLQMDDVLGLVFNERLSSISSCQWLKV